MPRKRSVFNESKQSFINRKKKTGVRKIMHEDPLLGAKREDSAGNKAPFFTTMNASLQSMNLTNAF